MKKVLPILIVILVSGVVLSFNSERDENVDVIITVTADKQTSFDMFQNTETVTVLKGLKTPYQLKIKSGDSKFIFKSNKPKTSLKIEAKKQGGGSVMGSWPITVLLVNGSTLSTFGID